MAKLIIKNPIMGFNKRWPLSFKPPYSTAVVNNIRSQSTQDKRTAINPRPAVVKWSDTQISGSAQPIVALGVVSSVE